MKKKKSGPNTRNCNNSVGDASGGGIEEKRVKENRWLGEQAD